ncbi:MAG: hypothetical protein H6Q74_1513 [Firmicutes bacterium]|nr:hypothetical protein [Bacillota bacterium]
MEQKYAATYYANNGKSVINIVDPPPVSDADKASIIEAWHKAFWIIWQSIPVDQQRFKQDVSLK